MTHAWWWLAVDGLCVYRLAVLLAKDKITDPLRLWLWMRGYNPDGSVRSPAWRWVHELAECPWCNSVWFAAGAAVLTVAVPGVWAWPAIILAFSAVAGFLAER